MAIGLQDGFVRLLGRRHEGGGDVEPTHGEILGSVTVPANTMPEETFRDFVVLDDGGVLYAVRTANGVTYYETDCS